MPFVKARPPGMKEERCPKRNAPRADSLAEAF